jgi:hypothetical protein
MGLCYYLIVSPFPEKTLKNEYHPFNFPLSTKELSLPSEKVELPADKCIIVNFDIACTRSPLEKPLERFSNKNLNGRKELHIYM